MKINPNINTTNSNIITNSKTKEVAAETTTQNTPKIIQTTNNIGMYILSKLENINKLDNIQKMLFLKEMLNLPDEWKDLLIFAALKSSPSANSEQLLSKLIDFNLLKKDINQTSNEILNKLLKLLTPQMAAKSSEIQQMMEILQKFLPSSETKTPDFIKDLMLMYLPYLPLKEDFKLRFQNKNNNDDNSENNSDAIIIILTTKNMGTFRIEIFLENSTPHIQIDNNSDSLNKRFLTGLKEIKQKLEIKNEISIIKNKNIQSSNEQSQHIISSSKKIHPQILIIAYEIIKMILELDNKLSIVKSRELKD
ncbi:MAG TPA: hypothetical protein H9673_02135 [Candidatus Adamsella sp.]|nr:hypothetical protein [Candidatus Adamsella sp.]